MKRITLNGMLSALGLLLAFSGGLWAGTVNYQYDALHRLTRVSYADGTQIAYSYDPAGNRTQKVVSLVVNTDTDGDGIPDSRDNCPAVPNPDQADLDADRLGDACDPDIDGDGVPNAEDAFPLDSREWVDTDADGIGNNADPDDDNDGVLDADDLDPLDPAVGGVRLSVAKTDTPDPVRAGSKLTYTIDYANDGASKLTATDAKLTETYDPKAIFATASPEPTDGNNVWALGDLPPGASGTITVTVDVPSGLSNGTELLNEVTLSSEQAQATATQKTVVERLPVLSLTKTDTDPVSAGSDFVYTLIYSNDAAANRTATNLVLTETYDPSTSYVSANPPPDQGNNIWHLGQLLPGGSGQITITMRAATPLPDGTQLTNRADLSSDQGAGANAQAVTTIHSSPALSLEDIDTPDPVQPGGELTYRLAYGNGSSANAVASNVMVRETYDPNVTFLRADPAPDIGTINAWSLGHLDPGETGTILVYVQVNRPLADGTQISNTAVIASDQASASAQATTIVNNLTGTRYVATGEIAVAGKVSGTYVDTHALDGVSEAVVERSSGGKAQTRYSYLEHKWLFAVGPAQSDGVVLHATVAASKSADDDAFELAYSTDDLTYTSMFTVYGTGAAQQYRYPLPTNLSGSLYVRARDTVRTPGTANALDTLSIDEMYVLTQSQPVSRPNTPTGLSASAVSTSQIDLTWGDNSDNEAGFYVERYTGTGWARIASVGAGITGYYDTGLPPNTTFRYRVVAYNDAGESNPSTWAEAKTLAPSISVSASTRKAKSNNYVDLSWSGATTANVIVRRDGQAIADTANDGSYTDVFGKKVNSSYRYQVCEKNTGVCSSEVTVTF
jgi:YD repeat-containing protein